MSTLRTIRARLERWELQHLREHCAQLAQRVEDLELDVTREAGAADHWRNQCQALIEDLQDAGQTVGMTVDGELGTVKIGDPPIDSKDAAAIVGRARAFAEGFAGDATQEGVDGLIWDLDILEQALKGGAA